MTSSMLQTHPTDSPSYPGSRTWPALIFRSILKQVIPERRLLWIRTKWT